ncbi:Serine/Threonine kinase domain protein (macronuclear) [Tetrahymena thermophila SB210]|uniref:Serine/Threonine kinase domain protein n=1 Tax=Tetrahymena thermophila (strain SB210) TaxID=312017 RepID=I7LZN3_TETTS|nr:Serine/Threonine kinase domain protein [Tetrahymena thermophila SB210]EAR84334.2 Serine/Threonine kinase domain protein [Tetrahymena thermophila SB210]|eukprot:XP_001031997.2 Serine/Threonine kinase domain protein [Tetrahymena thermophila SB210]
MDMQISSDLRRLFRQHQLPNDKEMEIATFKIFFYPHKFLAKKKKERCLMITESKLRILTNNPRGDRSRDEVIKKRQLIKNICAFTTSENSNQIVIHFHQNIDESDWQIECQYKTIVFDTLVKVYYQKKKERITCFIMQEKSLDRFVTTREIKKNNKNNMPVHEKQGKKTILFLPEEEIKQENVHSSEILFNLDKLTKLGLISESEKSKVYLVKYGEKSTNKFALKEIKASDCKISEKIQLQIKDNSYKLKLPKNCPFLIQLLYTSEDNGNLFFLMPYFNKGDLQMHLSKNNKFTEDQVRFFAVEICLALEEFHSRGVVYKDLIPENILINDKGHVFLTDFGNARFNILQDDHQPPDTIITCYTAPEVLKGEDYSKLSDYWCFGVLLYELLTGVPPFYSENLELQYKLILEDELEFPSFLNISYPCQQLIKQLLQKDPKKRLGSEDGFQDLMNHDWFQNQSFEDYQNFNVEPLYVPHITFEAPYQRMPHFTPNLQPQTTQIQQTC